MKVKKNYSCHENDQEWIKQKKVHSLSPNKAHQYFIIIISPPLDAILSRNCPYLDTIDRSVLDFDFEKLCSISLLNNNVYACLVCGKYFQGR